MKKLFVLCVIAVVFACSSRKQETQGTKAAIDSVETVVVKKMQPQRAIVLPGDLRPWEVVHIQAKVKGYVRAVNADRGTFVKKGSVMATLEAPELQAQKAEALARVEDFKSKQIASQQTYSRLLQTSKTEGAVAANELDIAKSRKLVDSMQVLSAIASYEAVKQMINYLSITAPFDGIVTERNISPGELVGPDRAKPMFMLENSETLRLTVGIPEVYSGQLKSNELVQFKVTAIPEKVFQAKVSRSSQSLDFTLRSMTIEMDVSNKDHTLKSGMYAEVTLPVERSSPTMFVPASSVVNSTERIFVIKVADGQATWIDVKTGVQADGMVEIFGSVEEGTRIAAKASEELRNGVAAIAK